MDQKHPSRHQKTVTPSPEIASELNNLLQIISGTSSLIEKIWKESLAPISTSRCCAPASPEPPM